jgi:thiol-disulfide isomerase/thioredoxin
MIRMLVVVVLSVLGLVSSYTPGAAQDKKEPSPTGKSELPLKAGDPAPALKVTRWLQGEGVRTFEPGKVYVVEFWATWCGPCIRHMPHLAELQARFKDQGVTVIGVTARDILERPDNTEEKAAAFVKKRGPALGYAFAYADAGTMIDPWMKGQEHFCTFVVDKAGRIAYAGGPLFLDMVLPKVLAGDAIAKAVGDEMAKVDADYRTVCGTLERDRNPEAFLRGLKGFEAKYPLLADFLPAAYFKLHLLLEQSKAGEGKEYAERLVAKAIKQHNVVVLEMAYVELSRQKESKDLMALAVRAAEALVRIVGETDAYSLLRLADAYLVSGDKAKAKACARKAIDAAATESPAFRQEIEKEARKFVAEK